MSLGSFLGSPRGSKQACLTQEYYLSIIGENGVILDKIPKRSLWVADGLLNFLCQKGQLYDWKSIEIWRLFRLKQKLKIPFLDFKAYRFDRWSVRERQFTNFCRQMRNIILGFTCHPFHSDIEDQTRGL